MLTAAAGKIEIAPGIELGRAFWTHAQALHKKRVYAGLRALARRWPQGHAPQAFLALFAQVIRGATIDVRGCDPVVLANRVQSPSAGGNPIKGPYLVLVVVGEYPEAHGYAPLQGYAQPIYSGRRFIPVDSEFDRTIIRALLEQRWVFDCEGFDLVLEKPVFDILTPLGPCRPDFRLELRSRSTGEIRQIIVEAAASDKEGDLAAKAISRPRMAQIAPVVSVTSADIDAQRLEQMLWQAFRFYR